MYIYLKLTFLVVIAIVLHISAICSSTDFNMASSRRHVPPEKMSSAPKTFAGHPNLTPYPNTGARPKLSVRYTYPSPSQNPRHPQQPITNKILAGVAALERRISETIPLLSRQQQTGSSPNIPVHTTPGSYYSMIILTYGHRELYRQERMLK